MSDEPTVASLFDLKGRVALVTGASGHLGRALGCALAEAGATIIVASRDEDRARSVATALPATGGVKHHGVVMDQLVEESIQRGVDRAEQLAGKIDVLINNAHEPEPADWTTVTAENFDRQMRNATGYFLLARAIRDRAVRKGAPASIVMLGSMYGSVGSYPDAYEGVGPASAVAYHALKGGVLQMTRHLAVYWAKDRVRVNALSPGPFPAPTVSPALVANLTKHSPMRRMGRPHELKGAVVFLASDASSYVTGHNLVVDGGWAAW
jgi:gluconate 5-dehydrogenase